MPWVLRMILMISGMLLVVQLYLGWRISAAADIVFPHRKKVIRRWIVGCSALFFLLPVAGGLQFLFFDEASINSYPDPVVYLFWFGLAFSFQLLSWVISFDIIRLIARLRFNIDRIYGWAVLGITAIIFIYTGFKLYYDSTRIVTEQLEVVQNDLPEELENLRIIHITDIQADEYTSRDKIARYVERINELNPDLVIFTGDLVTNGTDYLSAAAEELAKIEATYGMLTVVGDHDYWAGMDAVREVLEEYEIPLLENENRDIEVDNGSKIRVTGVTEVYSQRAERENVEPLLENEPQVFSVFASHQLSEMLLELVKEAQYPLALAGHTHGGQIRLPFFWKKYSAPDFETRFVGGTYREGDLIVNVDNGLGFTLSPVRYNAPATISVIDLVGS